MIPSNAHKFIDERHAEDRRVRRTSWFGSKVYALTTQSGQSGENGHLAPKREDVLRALNASHESDELNEMAKKFFAMLDALVLNRFKAKDFPQDQMIAGSASVILAPDYVIHCSGDNRNKLNYVSVLAGNKILNIRDENNFAVTDKNEKTQIFLSLEDKSKEAKNVRSNLMKLDTLVSVEKLEGKRLRNELPKLNNLAKRIADCYGGLEIIEAEIRYLVADRNDLDLSGNRSAAPDHVAELEVDADALAEILSKSKLCKGRVRLNLNSNSELETVDVLCEASDTEQMMKESDDCVIILMSDYKH
jgi:hypothetical protein